MNAAPRPKLPRALETDPRAPAVEAALAADARPLWERGVVRVAHRPLTESLRRALAGAALRDALEQGLEGIEARLQSEQRGLDALRAKPGAPPPGAPRVSRLLVLASDGSQRFYRDAEALLRRYEARLLGLRLDAPGDALGPAVLGREALARALLIADRDAVGAVLLALVPPAP
ncbi:MAG TPA: hypothetical protein VFS00_20320 [Polyangiaceae bacterium]|nr:hypothetical protein [Polyangiaceae bacterium]